MTLEVQFWDLTWVRPNLDKANGLFRQNIDGNVFLLVKDYITSLCLCIFQRVHISG